MNRILFLFSLALSLSVNAQDSSLVQQENELSGLLTKLRNAENDKEKEAANSAFKAKIAEVVENEACLSYKFSKLNSIGIIDSPDGQMRIINWNVEQDDFSHNYYCYILWKDDRRGRYHQVELKDNTFGMPSMPSDVLTSDQWYGALYYRIIPVDKGSRTIYTVLGWDHHSEMSTMKLVDAIYFVGDDVKLGTPIFKVGNEVKKRLFFEHAEKASMYLNYEEDRKRIMMDHLSPESPSMANFREYYVPDLSYDALEYDGKRWVLKEDVIGVNKGDGTKKQTVYTKNDNGMLEAKEIENSWKDPSNPNAPGGGNVHVAVTPEEQSEAGKTKNDPDLPKADKRDKRDPSEISFMKGVQKKKRKRKKNR